MGCYSLSVEDDEWYTGYTYASPEVMDLIESVPLVAPEAMDETVLPGADVTTEVDEAELPELAVFLGAAEPWDTAGVVAAVAVGSIVEAELVRGLADWESDPELPAAAAALDAAAAFADLDFRTASWWLVIVLHALERRFTGTPLIGLVVFLPCKYFVQNLAACGLSWWTAATSAFAWLTSFLLAGVAPTWAVRAPRAKAVNTAEVFIVMDECDESLPSPTSRAHGLCIKKASESNM